MRMGPETESMEYKKSTGELKNAIVSLASMLNKNGYGTVFFGVGNNGEAIGQLLGDATLRDVSQAIANFIKPQVIPTITLELIDEKNIVKVYVEGTDKPYSAYGRYYMRSADEDRELSPSQLKNIMEKKVEADSIVRIPAISQRLSFGQLRTLYAIKGLSVNDSEFEWNTGLRMENGNYNYLAELMSDINDVSIKVVTFAGRDKSVVKKRNEYGFKCLVLAMEQVLSYVESINETLVDIGSKQREESKLFDMESFREAWTNACLHTRWDMQIPPAVYVFKDRIEVISTGGLPQGMTKEEFFKGISYPVNLKLQKIFGQLGYVEQTGHGIPLITKNYGTHAFELTRNHVNVVIPFNKENEKEPKEPVTFQNHYSDNMNRSQSLLYSIVSENPNYTIKDMVKESGMSDGYVRKVLQFLKTNGYVEREGSNKTGHWKTNVPTHNEDA